MKDENFCTLGGRITHPAAVFSTNNQGYLLSFSIANHSTYSGKGQDTPLYLEVKVAGGNNRAKLDAFAERLPKGRKVTIHNADLQRNDWENNSGERQHNYYLFCRLDQIFLHALPSKTEKATPEPSSAFDIQQGVRRHGML